jgi:DNA-binding response OmpR family regulator
MRPIIAVGAHGTADAGPQAHDAGATLYLQKPALPEELLQHVGHTVGGLNEDVRRREWLRRSTFSDHWALDQRRYVACGELSKAPRRVFWPARATSTRDWFESAVV